MRFHLPNEFYCIKSATKWHENMMPTQVYFTHNWLCDKQIVDQYQYLGNCPPTPPLNQQKSIDNNLGLMLG